MLRITDSGVGKARALIVLANGFEEIEFATTLNLLHRAGVDVSICGLNAEGPITGLNKMVVIPDKTFCLASGDTYDAIILPGGICAVEAMKSSPQLGATLAKQEQCCKVVGAMDTAPVIIKQFNLFKKKSLTSHPSAKGELEKDYDYKEEDVVNDFKLITSRGPGTAHLFGLTLILELIGAAKAKQVAELCLYPYC